jgi:suppressor for copper-sensitivity B
MHVRFFLLSASLAMGCLVGPPVSLAQTEPADNSSELKGAFPSIRFGNLSSQAKQEPVTWSARYLNGSDDQARLEVTATLAPSWHIYSMTQAKGGPLPTNISIVGPQGVTATADFTPDREPARSVSSTYKGLTIEEYEDKVTWTAPLKIPAGFAGEIEVKVQGLVCDSVDGRCMRTAETLTAVSDPTQTSGQPKTFRDEDYAVQWTASLNPATVAAGQVAVLSITAEPDEGFHIYRAAVDDAPFSTNFVVTDKSGLLSGPPQTDVEVISDKPVESMPPVHFHPGKVSWKIPFRVPADATSGQRKLSGMIAYLACTKTGCLMPKGLRWDTTLSVAQASGTESAVVEIRSVKAAEVKDASATTKWVDDANFSIHSPIDDNPTTGSGNGAAGGTGDTKSGGNETQSIASSIKTTVLQSTKSDMSFLNLMVFAFLGGIILNVMPCVLPVIGLKVMSFINQAGEDRGRVLTLNLAYVAGIFVVFAILATLATFFGLGWGAQFQNFGVRMTAIIGMFAFALSYLGVWEIPTPGLVSSKASRDLQNKEGIPGAFSKGVFATVLATPCSAPLLGGVFSALLGAPAATVYTVFFSIAAGMAFPYLVIGFVPAAAKLLPKPGAWMETFKELMAFVMLGAVAFFFYQFSDGDKLAVFITLIGVWFGCWIIGKMPEWESAPKRLASIVAGVAAAAAIGWFGFNGIKQDKNDYDLTWVDYSDQSLQKFQEDGRTVMVDFSAKWCVNCLLNLENAIDTGNVAKVIDELDAVAIYADLTDHNPAINLKLRELESNAIPVLAIYPGGRPNEPIILRDLVTEQDVISALQQAGPSVPAVTRTAMNASR